MNRLPSPFAQEGSQQRHPADSSSSMPAFLLMTRPPGGANSYGGRRGNNHSNSMGNNRQSFSNTPASGFMPFSPSSGAVDTNTKWSSGRGRFNSRGGSMDGGMRGSYRGSMDGGGGMRGSYQGGSPRYSHPYQQTPRRHNQNFNDNQNFPGTPRSRSFSYGQGGDSYGGSSGGGRFNRGHSSRGRGGERGPISDIPIDKFVSRSMVQDPWMNFDDLDDCEDEVSPSKMSGVVSSPTVVTLDNSEIVIDSDASVIVESSYDEGASGLESDIIPLPDIGSESPHIATSSTSEKDTGSDTASDG